MRIVAINTVEIEPVSGSETALRGRLEGLLATLNRTSGCAAYSLACGGGPGAAWLVTGHWDSTERMCAHFELPCLAELFDLVAQRWASGLRFGSFFLLPIVAQERSGSITAPASRP